MTDITEEIHSTIKKLLPQHVGEVLTKELSDYADLKKAFAALEARHTILSANHKDALQQISNMQIELGAHENISNRMAEVKASEMKQELRNAEVRFAELRRQDAVDLVKMVFKSPMFRAVQSAQEVVAVPATPPTPGNQYGTSAYPHVAQVVKTIDTGEL